MKNNSRIMRLVLITLLSFSTFSSLFSKTINEDDQRKFDYFFMEASRHKMKGDYQKAAALYQNSLQLDPNSAIAHFELGKIVLMSGDNKNAIDLLTKATQLNDKNDWYKIYLAGVYQHTKKDNSAIDLYLKLKRNHPEKLEYYYQLGDLYTKTKQYLAAVQIYDEIEKREGQDEALSLEKQRLYLMAGEQKKAKKELDKLIEKHPEQARYSIILGDFYLSIQEPKKALKSYKRAENLDPNNGFLHMSFSNYYSLINDSITAQQELVKAFNSTDIQYEPKLQILLNYMVQSEENKTLLPLVETLCNSLKENYPDEPNTYFFYANLLLNDSSKQAIVVDNLNSVIKLSPDHEDARIQLIQIAFQNEDFEQVLQQTEEAILAGVKTTRIYFFRGIAAQQEKKYIQAKESYENAIGIAGDKDPIKTQLYGNLGDINYELKRPKEAFANYEKALALDEHNTLVMNNYAYYLSENDTLLDLAEKMSTRCIDLEPGNPTFLDTYAWILYKRNNLLLAKFYMEKAIHNSKEINPVLFDHYGDILYANGDQEEAKIYWRKALETGGNNEEINAKLLRP